MRSRVSIDRRAPPDHRIKFDYDAQIVSLIKALVPSHARSYDRTTKTWSIDDPHYVQMLEAELKRDGYPVTWIDDSPPPAEEQSDEYAADQVAADVLTRIEPKHQGAVFRAMGRILYPD